METIEALRRRIQTAEDLHGVVKTMKALAAVNIRHCEKAVESLAAYNHTVALGLQAILRMHPGETWAKVAPRQRLGAVVFGSDQGMCGPFNEHLAAHVLTTLGEFGVKPRECTMVTVGTRITGPLEDAGIVVEETLSPPTAPATMTLLVQDLLLRLDEWRAAAKTDWIILFYNHFLSGGTYRPDTQHLLPVDQQWLQRLAQQPWSSRTLPMFTSDREQLFSALIREYLFVTLCRAGAESIASENASRLASMQNAERNIIERLHELQTLFHQQRQDAITGELLDIVAGFEALSETHEH
ncbi:MAG: F0F1 ATP synthase subunit gamma [Candidatus Binatia bacterium]